MVFPPFFPWIVAPHAWHARRACAVGGAHHIKEVGEDGEAHVPRRLQHPVAGQILAKMATIFATLGYPKRVIWWDFSHEKWRFDGNKWILEGFYGSLEDFMGSNGD